MKKYKISAEEFDKVRYKRLANSPGANSNYGESKLKGEDLKARMDKPLELFMAKFNLLIALIAGTPDGDRLTKNIPTDINSTHTLYDLIRDVTSKGAEFASYLSVGDQTLLEKLEDISNILKEHTEHVDNTENPHNVTAAHVGLGKVNNTSDEEKPLSAASRAAIETLRNEMKENKDYVESHFIGVSGSQTIDGELAVKRLYVEGTVYSTDVESLNVKERFICANSDGVPIAGLTGFIIRIGGDEAYGIVHDTVGRCVKIGLGVYDSDSGEFVFSDGEAQALATRGEISDGEMPVWDGERNTFKGSGVKAKDIKAEHAGFAKRIEVANALKGSASGEVVALKDVSPLEHGLGVRVSSKNLADIYAFSAYGMISPSLANAYGTTISTTEPSDSIEIMQSQTGNQTNVTSYTNGYFCIGFRNHFKDGDKITLSFDLEIKENPLNAKVWKFFMNGTSGGADVSITSGRVSTVIEWSDKDDGKPYIEIRNAGCSCVVSNIQLEKGTTATAYTPFVPDVGAVKLRAQGADILNIAEMLDNQLVDNGDGTYTLTKHGSDGLRFSNACKVNIPIGVYIKITNEIIDYNIDSDKTDSFGIQFRDADNNARTISFFPEKRGSSQYFSIDVSEIVIYADSAASNGSYVRFKNFQIEYGKVGSEYEPYIEPVEYAVNADGTVEGVKSIYPATTLTTDTVGALIEVDYNRDINKAFEELRKVILSLGGIL